MERKNYYIRVGSGEILEDPTQAEYEYIINATDEEVDRLRVLMNDRMDADNRSYVRSHIPIREYHNDEPNDDYDAYNMEIYRMIYYLGNKEARDHIKTHILPELS